MKKLLIIVGTRPNFIKITQFPRVLENHKEQFEYKIVHTGQHFDDKMSTVFFDQFGFQPDIFLSIEPGSPNSQMAKIMLKLEEVINAFKPDLVLVPGDVNSTFAAALTANKMNVKIAHIESGLRSFDTTMPEEFNRILTDNVTDIFLITEQSGKDNLLKEGKREDTIHFVGNTMIDTMVAFEKEIDSADILERLKISPQEFVLMTMHRPATVDTKEGLTKLLELIHFIASKYKLAFPIHPRTVNRLKAFDLHQELENNDRVILLEPLDYFSFQKLIQESKMIITDSGGIQEESTFLQVPCLTLRPNTERPITVTLGSNELVPFDLAVLRSKIEAIENGAYKKGKVPPLWDGKATERIVEVLLKNC